MNETMELVTSIASDTAGEVRQRCQHGVNLCDGRSNALCYDPEIYRSEIGNALARAKRILKYRVVFIKGAPTKSAGEMDFEELVQDVNVEILEAQRHYGNRMNAQLAYQIAENQANAFLGKRINSQTILVKDAAGNPVLDDFGLARCLDGPKLNQQSKDLSATPEERRKAKKLLQRYARRHPRFVSLDHKPRDERDRRILTSVQHGTSRIQAKAGSDLLQTFLDLGGVPALRQIVGTWHGDKRRVGEAMLEPNFTVRSVPGLDKSKVSRVRQDVLKDLKAFITRSKH